MTLAGHRVKPKDAALTLLSSEALTRAPFLARFQSGFLGEIIRYCPSVRLDQGLFCRTGRHSHRSARR
jgi:hypothetical protein